MKKIIYIILIIFLYQGLIAQNNIYDGYIVSLKGDTIQGFIDYGNWNDNPDYIEFSVKLQGESKRFQPTDILAFGVANDIYESAKIEYEISPRSTEILKFNPDLVIEEKLIFLRVIFKGEKTLAVYKTHSGIDNHYIFYNDKYQLLIYKRYLQKTNGKSVIKTNNKYIGQLSLYFSNCPEISTKIASVKYSEASLSKLFRNYYAVSKDHMVSHYTEEENNLFAWSVFAGTTHQTVKFFNYMKTNNVFVMKPYVSPVIGGALDITFGRTSKRWSLNNELMYTSIKTQGESPLVDNYLYTWELNFTYLSMVNMFRYQYEFGKTAIFANVGIINGYAISMYSHESRYNTFNGQTKVSEMGLNRKMEFGKLFGIGARFKKNYQVEVRYQTSNGMSPYVNASSQVFRWFALFSYRF